MTNAGRLGVLAAMLAALVAAVLWSTRRGAPVDARPSAAPREQRSSSEPAPRLEPSPPAKSTRPDPVVSAEREPAAQPSTASLPVYRADVPTSVYPVGVFERPAEWSERTGADWRIAAVRLSAACVQLVPVGDASKPTTIPEARDHAFELSGFTAAADAAIECELASLGDDHLSNSSVLRDEARSVAFADAYTIQAIELPEDATFAYCRLRFSVDRLEARVKLPAGEYRISGRSAPFGWWIEEGRITIGDGPTLLRAVPLPVTSVTLPLSADGQPKVPARVVIIQRQRPRLSNQAPSTGEFAVETQRTDNALLIANHRSLWVDPYTDYAFVFYWPDGSQTTTSYGSAADLARSVDLRN